MERALDANGAARVCFPFPRGADRGFLGEYLPKALAVPQRV
jgi:hypothetical protein